MQLEVLAALLLYAAATFLLAWRGRGGDTLDYLLAGRRLTVLPFVATLVATWYGGVLGVGEYSYRFGISNWLVFGVPYYLAALLFAFWLARPARSSAALSIPDQLRTAYGPPAARIGTLLVFAMAVPAAYVLMLGELGSIYLGLPLPAATLGATAFLVAYLAVGGFRGVVGTNALQFVLMFAAFAVLLPVALAKTGGVAALWRALPPTHRSWDGGMGLQHVAVWYAIALQTLVEPTFYQRCYAARSPRVARTGILVSVLCWIVFDALTTASGLAARVLLPDLADPVLAYPALGRAVLPAAANAFFAVGLVATVASTAQSYLFLAGATVGHDLAPALCPRADQRRWSVFGLSLAAVAAVALALSLRSVVQIWHDVGTVVTAALLLPLALAHAPARYRASPGTAALSMALTASVALLWTAARRSGAYPLGLEPIFPALATSALVWGLDRLRLRRRPLEL